MGGQIIPPHLAFIEQALSKRVQSNLLREIPEIANKQTPFISLKNGRKLLDFSSNDYLGLSTNFSELKLTKDAPISATSSRLLGGDSTQLREAENEIANIFGDNSNCTIFPSTWQANTSVIPALVGRRDLVITDKYAHNSIINASKLSGAKLLRFKHNDLTDLARLLSSFRANYKNCLVATESVFSMQGSVLDYQNFLQICTKYNVISFVDEAHAYGVFGEKGIGLIPKNYAVDIRVGALGKAAASSGGFVVCTDYMKQYLTNFADGLIYSTAISPLHASIIQQQIKRLKSACDEREQLADLVRYAADLFKEMGVHLGQSLSHIIPIPIGDDEKCLKIKEVLLTKGYWVAAIRPPTVPIGQACIRISLTAKHTKEQLSEFANNLSKLLCLDA